MQIGRASEVAALLAALDDVAAGQGARVVLVRGPGGIGKTTLVRHAADLLRERGIPVLVGRPDEVDRWVPFGILRDLLTNVDRGRLPLSGVDRLIRMRQLLSGLIESGGAPTSRRERSTRLLSDTVALLHQASSSGPVALVLEDIHVADPDSLSLLALVTRHLREVPVLLVITVRTGVDEEVAEFTGLVDRLVRSRRATVIELGPLSGSEIGQLLEFRLAGAASPELLDHVMTSSRGNPLLATELARQLSAEGAVHVREGVAELALGELGPHRRATGLLARFLPLHHDEARVARVLAVFGQFSITHLPLLESLTGVTPARLADCFDRLLALQLLELGANGRYEFAHPMLRDSVYTDLGDAERHYLHRAIADLLTRRRAEGAEVDIFELARHATSAADISDGRAWQVAVEAADAAMPQAPLVAAGWYSRALEHLPREHPDRPTVQAQQVYALLVGARTNEATAAALKAVAALTPSAVRADLTFTTANVLFATGRPVEALRVVEAELAAGARRRSLACIQLHLLAQTGQTATARDVLSELESTEWPEEVLLDATRGEAHLLCYSALTGQSATLRGADARIRTLLPSMPATTQVGILHLLAMTRIEGSGPLDAARLDLAQAEALRAGDGNGGTGALVQTVMAWLEGRWDEALQTARAALPVLDHRGAMTVQPAIRAIAAMIRCDSGDLAGARAVLGDAAAVVAASRPYVAVATARVLRSAGHERAARDLLSMTFHRARESGTVAMIGLVVEELVAAELAVGRAAAAARVAEQGLELVGHLGWPVVEIFAQRAVALATNDSVAAARAAALAEANGAHAELARCWLTLAEIGVDPAANAMRAWQAFHDMGAVALRARAAAVIRQSGATVPRDGPTDGRLSRVESDLVRLVASGLTNRQIADQLSYSVKTVEAYLSRIYAKTGCKGRVDLVSLVLTGAFDELASETG